MLIDPTGRDPSDPRWLRVVKEGGGFVVGSVEGVVPFGSVASRSSDDADIDYGQGIGLAAGASVDVGGGGAPIGGAGACTVGTVSS